MDLPDGSSRGLAQDDRRASTLISFYGLDGSLLYSSFVPASPGGAGVSFLGVIFDRATVASVQIRSGNGAPGADDEGETDIAVMDDFHYGEPQPLR